MNKYELLENCITLIEDKVQKLVDVFDIINAYAERNEDILLARLYDAGDDNTDLLYRDINFLKARVNEMKDSERK